MLVTNLKAGLGNQMFAYALTRSVAEFNHYEFGVNPIPEYDYHGYNGIPQMDFMDIDYGKNYDYKLNEIPHYIKHVWQEKDAWITYSNGDTIRYFPYQPDVFGLPDNTKLFVVCGQNANYLPPKTTVREWFRVKNGKEKEYKNALLNMSIELSENVTVMHVRGGDYHEVDPHVLLKKDYWDNAVAIMKNKNPDMKFICVTDDIPYAQTLFGDDVKIMSNEIGLDYYIINNAKNLILSNSSFNIFPAWLSEQDPFVIAPRYWWRYNISTGYWCSSDIYTFGFKFLDRNGELYDR